MQDNRGNHRRYKPIFFKKGTVAFAVPPFIRNLVSTESPVNRSGNEASLIRSRIVLCEYLIDQDPSHKDTVYAITYVWSIFNLLVDSLLTYQQCKLLLTSC